MAGSASDTALVKAAKKVAMKNNVPTICPVGVPICANVAAMGPKIRLRPAGVSGFSAYPKLASSGNTMKPHIVAKASVEPLMMAALVAREDVLGMYEEYTIIAPWA